MAAFTDNIADSYVVVDLETTGLSPAKETIIEIAAVKVINNDIVSTYSTLVDPCRHISSEITMLTGIDDRMVRGAPCISEAMKGFLAFAGDMTLLGHNIIGFDMKFLELQADLNNKCIDTLHMARHMKTGSNGCSLSALCERFGVINTGAHRALSDCEATHKVYLNLKQLYKNNGAYFNMAVSCSCKKHRMNIEKYCSVGCELTALYDEEKKRIIVLCNQNEIGTVNGGKMKEYMENIGIIRKISLERLSLNAKGNYLIGAHVDIGEF